MQPNKIKQLCVGLLIACIAFLAPSVVFAQAKALPAGIKQAPHFAVANGNTAEAVQAKKMVFIQTYPAVSRAIAADAALAAEFGISGADYKQVFPQETPLPIFTQVFTAAEVAAMPALQQAEVMLDGARYQIK